MRSTSNLAIWVVLALGCLASSAGACGCRGCHYMTELSCARCCANFVKRNDQSTGTEAQALERTPNVPLFWLRYNGPWNKYGRKKRSLEDVLEGVARTRRDTCGCSMGCFFSDPLSCSRCCSQGMRRDTNQLYYPSDPSQDTKNLENIIELLLPKDG